MRGISDGEMRAKAIAARCVRHLPSSPRIVTPWSQNESFRCELGGLSGESHGHPWNRSSRDCSHPAAPDARVRGFSTPGVVAPTCCAATGWDDFARVLQRGTLAALVLANIPSTFPPEVPAAAEVPA